MERKGRRGRLTKHQEMNCIHDVELDTTLHSTILDRTSDASSGRDAMLRGMWTRIWGDGGEAVVTPGVRDSGAAGLSLLMGWRLFLGVCNWVWRTDVSLRA